MRRITVTASTIGQQNPGQVSRSGGYRYRGDKNWPEDRSAYEQDSTRAKPDGGPGSAERKQKRISDFAAALRDLGRDPWTSPAAAVAEAGRRVGVGYDTAREYRNELRRRQSREVAP